MSRQTRRQILAGLAGVVATGGVAQAQTAPGLAAPPPRKPPPRPGRLIEEAGLGAAVRYAVFDPDGALLEGRGADQPVAPASTLKILTALYALDRLGGGRRFATRVLRHGDTLILAGGGDPVLDSDALATLAGRVAAAAPQGIARLAVWGGALPFIAEISPEQADHLAYNPAVSGMMLNFNRVHLAWNSGGAGMAVTARARAHRPVAYTVRAAGVSGGPVFAWRTDAAREIWEINRSALRVAGSRWLPVRRPEIYAGDVFQTLARAAGLPLPAPEVIGDLPDGAVEIARIESPPLTEILRGMMEYSTNLTAEAVGLHASGAADLRASAGAMRGWAARQGIEGLDLRDHSGMSAQSRVTARAMAQVIATLGVRDGALRGLMRHVGLQDARGRAQPGDLRLDAKTGTLNFVSNLAGYGGLPGAREVIFAIYVSDMERRAATEGRELPDGVIGWTHRAKYLQQELVRSWLGRYG
ncbi:D-alanyl-D-alanine carboxypeptidase / D-alanyl-D-alanine-endopeptidase (penicillin-binding protein 4) [Paracoccus isoporae]|uniref:D-alanyl-D-alanine carboxypeptidase / D-alanyl-D-alanine-endopeptidase (Penicillin-binding protein 4) n=1 Tax=Paracoccus isoporae TaxID=591205 RepID=A0A1G7BEH1_9RHOB|nr:D-alanyl-D-alanine carboxypeptidase [Paracoccus isoporae]SDE25449.1 D-alanyl-D-alanine carboxypeptidase / D-alanyl-D-alanine-endopeptidase (penicillin-binding protein 4) [Paracoccus isoporae]